MDTANGPLKGPKAMNGIKASLNGRAVGLPRSRPVRSSPGVFVRLFNTIARVATWYAIIVVLFRCPATLELCDETSPRVCKPYFQIKHAVSPHLEPYYDVYAAPYVQAVKPYYDTVDRAVLTPSWHLATIYGAPQVARAQAFGRAQWQKTVQPQLARYQDLAQLRYDEKVAPYVAQVSTAVGPYLDIARTNALQTYHEMLLPTYQFTEPYLLQCYAAASAFTTGTAVPSALWAWNRTYAFLDGTVWPQLRVVYVETVEPQLVKIGQRLGRHNNGTVQKPSAEPASFTSTAASSFTKPTPSVASIPSSITSSSTTSTPSPPSSEASSATEASGPLKAHPVPGPNTPEEGEDEQRRLARETVAEDLKAWQEKYAKAADEGAAEINQRVEEIAKRMMRRQARTTGKFLVGELQKSVVTEMMQLRLDIISAVAAVQQGNVTATEGEELSVAAVRRAGMAIRDKAKSIRDWHEQYANELQVSVTTVADAHFQILGSIRDLALQKIGMKWAWMDGITYRDWAKYHQLRSRFDEWEQDLEKLVVSHSVLVDAQNLGQTIEDEGMEIAQSAAKELARLKEVAAWKIAALDASDEFDSQILADKAAGDVKSAVEDATEALQEKAEQTLEGTEDAAESTSEATMEAILEIPTPESAVQVDESVVSGISDETSAFMDTPRSDVESIPLEAVSAASIISETVANVFESVSSSAESAATESSASSSVELADYSETTTTATATNLPEEASAIILGETPIILGNATEAVEPGEIPTELPADESRPDGEDEDDPLESVPPVGTVTTTIKSVMFGAAAESVPTRQPILDDETYDSAAQLMASIQTELPQSISSVASSAYSAAISRASEQYSQAVSIVSAQIKGQKLPAHQEMLNSVSSAYHQATASASSRLDDALRAASDFYGSATARVLVRPTPTPTPLVDWARVEAIAAEHLSQGRLWAEEQYESAKAAVGLATPTPSSPAHRLMENARHNYYAGLGVAHARYDEFMSAASAALSSMTATPTPTDVAGTVRSVASVASESAASVVSVAGEGVSSAASVVQEGVSSAAYVAGMASEKLSESWDVAISQLSLQVYGAPTPTPWYASITSAAGEYAAQATHGASQVTAAAGDYAAQASGEAAKQYAIVSSIVSELLIGKEPPFSESVFSRLSGAYETGLASAASLANVVSEKVVEAEERVASVASEGASKVASVASEATQAVKETVDRMRDEL